ncbi:hypothetical protein NESM_000755800 [Novymonas esmeraldas]|uniref:Uncharacterized protein n=1 Tax=Novymonas esmeraldas TaxID=1808958 RepID=A0AAW0EXZ5_9TRYP
MRHSHYRVLLEHERLLRGDNCGWPARQRHVRWLTVLFFELYGLCTYSAWRHRVPPRHVWIDGVLVEVVEDTWVDVVRGWLLCAGLVSGALLALLRILLGHPPVPNTTGLRRTTPTETTAAAAAAAAAPREWTPLSKRAISTIAVPAWARHRADGRATSAGVTTTTTAAAAAAAAEHTRTLDAARPMRTESDLEWFLACENTQRQQHQPPPQQQQPCSSAVTGAGAASRQGDVISVVYDAAPLHQRGRGGPAAQTLGLPFASASSSSSLPWASLGITQLEEALQRTREWMSDVCRRLVADIEVCDRWFGEHQIEAYDCHHSLQELLPAPAPVPAAPLSAMRWGAPATVAAAPQPETKLAALVREKAHCRQTQQGMRELDAALRYDQRLTLEARLDVSGTFPSAAAARPSNAELTACRAYVMERLRTFAKQRHLASYDSSGGDAATWRCGFPCDAHLLLHVLRTSVKGLSEYVRFGYQLESQPQDLALYVGDTGEPYFYVRLRHGSDVVLLSPRHGPTSLMEAVLAFAAAVQVYHRGVYGGVRGTVDLSEVGLLKVIAERRRTS